MWFILGIWKLRGLRTGVGKGRWFVFKEENEARMPLKGIETPRWREELLKKKSV
jgi:hypothetical protein